MTGKSFYLQQNYSRALRKFNELATVEESELLLENQMWIGKTKLKLREFEDLDILAYNLALKGYTTVYRTTPHEGESCFTAPNLFEKTAIVIGNEANGASELDGSRSLTIPMPGDYESINAAQAATVVLFEYVRRTTSVS